MTTIAGLLVTYGGSGCGEPDHPAQCADSSCADGGNGVGAGSSGGGGSGGGSSSTLSLDMLAAFGDAEEQRADAVAFDSTGSFYVAGYYRGTFDIGTTTLSNTSYDLFLVKLTASGEVDWVHPFGQSRNELNTQAHVALAVDANDNVFVAGPVDAVTTVSRDGVQLTQTGNSSDLFVAKLTPTGDLDWVNHFAAETGLQAIHGLEVDDAGDLYVAGEVGAGNAGATLVDTPLLDSYQAFVVKLAGASGSALWESQLPHSNSNFFVGGVAVDADGQVAVTGAFTDIMLLGDANQIAAASSGTRDVFLAHLDASGALLSLQAFGDASGQSGLDVTFDSGGRLGHVGSFTGVLDLGGELLDAQQGTVAHGFLASFDAQGALDWNVGLGDSATLAVGIAASADDELLAIGSFSSTIAIGTGTLTSFGNDDLWLGAWSSDGGPSWGFQVGGPEAQEGRAVAVADDGAVAFVGRMKGSAIVGEFALESAGNYDLLIGLLRPLAQ